MSKNIFDLTTHEGIKEAEDFMDSPIFMALFPGVAMARWLFGKSDVAPKKQAEAAEKIIEAGRKNGAKRIKFKVDKHTGAKIKGKATDQIDIEGSIGQDGKMEIEIEYK